MLQPAEKAGISANFRLARWDQQHHHHSRWEMTTSSTTFFWHNSIHTVAISHYGLKSDSQKSLSSVLRPIQALGSWRALGAFHHEWPWRPASDPAVCGGERQSSCCGKGARPPTGCQRDGSSRPVKKVWTNTEKAF